MSCRRLSSIFASSSSSASSTASTSAPANLLHALPPAYAVFKEQLLSGTLGPTRHANSSTKKAEVAKAGNYLSKIDENNFAVEASTASLLLSLFSMEEQMNLNILAADETLFSAPVLIPHPVTMSDTFSMDDAKQMLKEILASTTDLQKRMVAQEDKLATLSDEVTSLKVDQG
ncbi:hypothetical protein GUJ93_ZPchr0077g7062 [Zizania palustris]|uniref:Uncharacterized protein n=1 Tax=Zizania palustris TaxID=103762 RepID=A0A8J5R2N6_ZIZPA|nr:hypothetical protein GUJ93_ZPchr0077g7062 [Zizania palustris]